jgi:hypothetical protein
MSQQIKVTKKLDVRGAVILGGALGFNALATGKTFYVDGTDGSDSYGVSSQDYNYPLLTITAAMDLCTANKGDAIVVLKNSPTSPPANETFPIAMDVAGVLLTGLYSRGLLSDSGFGADSTDTNCINATANFCTVENLYLGIKTGSTTSDVINASGAWAFTLRNCQIESQYTARYGVYLESDPPYTLIEYNKFGRGDLTNFTDCIKVANCTGGVIRNNLFTGSSAACVLLDGTCGNTFVVDNHFQLASDLSGGAITLGAGSSNNYVSGNQAGFGDTSMSQNPFLDSSTAGYNDWGLNYNQEAATLPA